ncbi:MAG TPA: 16S rRNA (cytidine(1402)-2'-O)-methyltransferase [Chiayiivirga sp.]|nr:16S rRNA (cytidine(1402)-2'-O)-methyltransferase [Chiayiivirga sp.]
MNATTPGRLHVVATPIGNLGDLSPRALETLRTVAVVAAEDTRHTRQLLAAFGVSAKLVALHEHNEAEQCAQLIARMQAGESVALVSDAGTPLVSDPGFRLVRAARAAGIAVSPVPGACAAIAALSVAGVASDRFVFEGFLPSKPSARRERLSALASETRTVIVYESSHRILDSLSDMAAVMGSQRHAVVARELTKHFETVLDGTLADLVARVAADADQQRGEFVVMIEAAPDEDADTALVLGRRIFSALREHLPPSQAARLAAEISGAPRKALYGPTGAPQDTH